MRDAHNRVLEKFASNKRIYSRQKSIEFARFLTLCIFKIGDALQLCLSSCHKVRVFQLIDLLSSDPLSILLVALEKKNIV